MLSCVMAAPDSMAGEARRAGLLQAIQDAGVEAFRPACEPAAAGLELFRDPEFDQQGLQVVWQVNPEIDRDGVVLKHGSVSVAPIDPVTGKFVLAEMQTVTDARPVRITITNNGPEWAYSMRGSEVFYTAYSADERTTRIGRLRRNANGRWKVEFLPGTRGKARPEPSKNPLDPRPRIYYATMIGEFGGGGEVAKGRFGWREDRWYLPVDHELPPDFGTGRWLPDSRWLFHHVNMSKFSGYLALYDTAAVADPPVTSDLTWYVGLGAWRAPELGGQTALLAATANPSANRIDLVVWRPDGVGGWVEWTRIVTIHPLLPNLGSPEPFVVNGRSYVLLSSAAEPTPHLTAPSVIWIASIDPYLPPEQQVRRVVSQEFVPDEVTPKADPEYAILPDGSVKIYYLDKGLKNDPLLVCDAGL